MIKKENIDRVAISSLFTIAVFLCVLSSVALADKNNNKSPHYTKVGFFDVHVCNWPKHDLFFMSLFSTSHFNDIKSVDVFYPDGRLLTKLDKNRYKSVSKKGKADKRVFISHTDIDENAFDGWYTATITMNNGEIHHSKDYVAINKLPMVSVTIPANSDKAIPYTKLLSWQPVAENTYYRIFIRDLWEDEKLIFTSKLSDKTSVNVPDGLLYPGGRYRWVIHARDVNEHPLYGDFNHGSMSESMDFVFEE